MPVAEVERVAPNEKITGVTFDMVALRDAARAGVDALRAALSDLPRQYGEWITAQGPLADEFAHQPRRHQMAKELIKAQADTKRRMEAGIDLLLTNDIPTGHMSRRSPGSAWQGQPSRCGGTCSEKWNGRTQWPYMPVNETAQSLHIARTSSRV